MSTELLILEPENFPSEALDDLGLQGIKVRNYAELDDSDESVGYAKIKYIMTRLGYFIDMKFLERFEALEYIITPTTGVTHIDTAVQDKYSIIKIDPVDPFIGEITPTAEHAILLLLLAQRNIKHIFRNIENHFNRPKTSKGTLKGHKSLIIGNGRIGGHVKRLLQAFTQDKITCFDSDRRKSDMSGKTMLQTLDKFDVVFICVKYANELVFDREFINKLNNNCILVNISRGELIDEDALLQKIKSSESFYYCSDVIKDEHLAKVNPLFISQKLYDNLILTPHIGGFCQQSLKYIEHEIVKKFIRQIEK